MYNTNEKILQIIPAPYGLVHSYGVNGEVKIDRIVCLALCDDGKVSAMKVNDKNNAIEFVYPNGWGIHLDFEL